MTDVPRQKLIELVSRHGRSLATDERRCRSLLSDVFGERYKRERELLVVAVREGVAGHIEQYRNEVPLQTVLARLSNRLHQNVGVVQDLARWSVESWALALGVTRSGGEVVGAGAKDGPRSIAETDQIPTPGTTLTQLLSDVTRFSAWDVRAIVQQLLGELEKVHRTGVAYGCLTPAQVIVHPKAVTYGFEFEGSAKLANVAAEPPSAGTRTVDEYMSPEQRAGEAVDVQCDIYAVGVLMFQLLTGAKPVGSEVPSDHNVGANFDPVYRRCTARRGMRYSSAAEVLEALDRLKLNPPEPSTSPELHELLARAERGDAEAMFSLAWQLDRDNTSAASPPDDRVSIHWYRKSADAGHAGSMNNLGWAYANGRGVSKDTAEALKWYRRGAEAGDSRAMCNLGVMYATGRGVTKDEAEALKWFRRGAEAGNARSMRYLGLMFEQGRGLAKDEAEAVKWYRRGAEAGDARAMCNLGVMYADGRGVAKDESEAVRWYRRGAEAGNARSMYDLGVMYANGRGVAKDVSEAARWYRRAAEAGDADAMHNLGVMYARGRGVPKDEAEAVKWYRRGAEAGNVRSMHDLGVMYANGRGVAKDEAEAVKWYRRGTEAGNARSMHDLGVMYANGRGVVKDEAEAVKWYRCAAEAGDADAMHNLGVMYANGRGVAKDEAEAVKCYRRGADAGNPGAMCSLGWAYANGCGVAKDEAEAAKWYRRGADAGNAFAMLYLGLMYDQGRGVTKDNAEAEMWFRRADEAGVTSP